MLKLGANIVYDYSGATLDSNILNLVKDHDVPLILGNHNLTKHLLNFRNLKKATYGDVFLVSLLERMELCYAKGIIK